MKMETLKVVKDGIWYLLYNLTIEKVRELRNDPQKLSQHCLDCLDTGRNICLVNDVSTLPTTTDRILDSNAPTTLTSVQRPCTSSALNASDAAARREFDFLCRTTEKQNYIYGIKFGKLPWHYFDEHDSMSTQHGSLPASVDLSISQLASIVTITVSLDEAQARQYFESGKFIFKNKELKTHLAIVDHQIGKKTSNKSTKRLVFISGQTNPLLFLKEFENCSDIKSDKDKMFQILDFVDECHKGEFTELYFTNDWHSVKSKFLGLYTLPFIENKTRELNVDFYECSTLRSFVDHKLTSLSKYRTLPFFNQIEMVMHDLPKDISKLFILHEKMTGNKTEILNFCDTIQDLVENFHEKTKDPPNEAHQESGQPSNRMEMEVFNYISEEESISPKPSRGRERGRERGRGRGRGGRGSNGSVRSGTITKRGSTLKSIVETNELNDDFSFLEEISESSRSSWSETN